MSERTRALRARDTRWLYRVESTALAWNREANRDTPMARLRALARRVWRAEAPGRPLPRIRAGRGVSSGGALSSYCEGYSEIVLARHHRTPLVLLHELTHALGPATHGARFVRRYFGLLWRYAGYSRWFLQQLAESRGVRLS